MKNVSDIGSFNYSGQKQTKYKAFRGIWKTERSAALNEALWSKISKTCASSASVNPNPTAWLSAQRFALEHLDRPSV